MNIIWDTICIIIIYTDDTSGEGSAHLHGQSSSVPLMPAACPGMTLISAPSWLGRLLLSFVVTIPRRTTMNMDSLSGMVGIVGFDICAMADIFVFIIINDHTI